MHTVTHVKEAGLDLLPKGQKAGCQCLFLDHTNKERNIVGDAKCKACAFSSRMRWKCERRGRQGKGEGDGQSRAKPTCETPTKVRVLVTELPLRVYGSCLQLNPHNCASLENRIEAGVGRLRQS